MTIWRDEEGRLRLEGDCPVEEAETLFALLQETPGAEIDWTLCTRLHTAVVQVLLALRPPMRGPCGDAFAARWIAPALLATG